MSARRGERRIRVTLEVGPRSARVASLEPLEGPAVQRPALEGTHVAQVMLGGATVLLQAFGDPLLARGIAPPGEVGHSFSRIDCGIVTVDVPLPEGELPGEIAIKVADLSKLKRRPTDPEGLQALLDDPPRAVRTVADVGAAELVRHPEWATLGLPGTPPIPPTGSFELPGPRGQIPLAAAKTERAHRGGQRPGLPKPGGVRGRPPLAQGARDHRAGPL